jgi:hypothetical protein
MTDRGKTIMCGVLFLDISEYSKKSVSGQISLKERFNAYLSVAIRDVPIDDRIILDTGDGAALSFLGDIGDALQVALSMRDSLRDGLHMEPALLVRMGINLGPVRLVRDLNGQPNIVGDGINVAQRVMGFADPGQILVSRSYYDAVSRLSPEYAGMFHYQGSRTDKHVREHEIYAIGYPGEFTGTLTLSSDVSKSKGERSGLAKGFVKPWRAVTAIFRDAAPVVRFVYASTLLLPIIAVVALVVALSRSIPPMPSKGGPVAGSQVPPSSQVAAVVPASAVVVSPTVAAPVPAGESHKEKIETTGHEAKETAEQQAKERTTGKEIFSEGRGEKSTNSLQQKRGSQSKASASRLSVHCVANTSVFVDGQPKGKTGNSPMIIEVNPGTHLVMLTPPNKTRIYSRHLNIEKGKTIMISPRICH